MTFTIVVLSGPVSSGKSTLAERLADRYGGVHLRTRELMAAHAQASGDTLMMDRASLQRYGERLDRQTNGRWVVDGLAPTITRLRGSGLVIIDAVRIPAQLEALREAFGRDVLHVHLGAPREVLDARYQDRRSTSPVTELRSYEEVASDPTEANIGVLEAEADQVINTQRSTADDVEVRCAASLGLLPRLGERLVDVIIGGGYGSEGKGNVAFYLAPEYDVLVRVGGPNAGHIVPLDPPYTHRLLPSGTQANERAQLVIGPGAVINVEQLLSEIADSQVEVDRLSIDPQAMVIEEEDRIAERKLREDIGSTGQGVGYATARRIIGRGRLPDGFAEVRLAGTIPSLAPYTRRRTVDVLSDAFAQGKRVLLEGTQGTALSLIPPTADRER